MPNTVEFVNSLDPGKVEKLFKDPRLQQLFSMWLGITLNVFNDGQVGVTEEEAVARAEFDTWVCAVRIFRETSRFEDAEIAAAIVWSYMNYKETNHNPAALEYFKKMSIFLDDSAKGRMRAS